MKRQAKKSGSNVHIEKAKKAQISRTAVVETQMVALEKISLLEENRLRVKEDGKTIDRYAEIYQQWLVDNKKDKSVLCPFGAVHVFLEKSRYCLTDGWLRYRAAQKAGVTKIACVVHPDKTTAMRAGMESNQRHGLPLSGRDKTHCIKKAVPALQDFSNRMIADIVGCSSSLVNQVVKRHQLRTGVQLTEGKDGKKRSVSKKSKKPVSLLMQFWLGVKRTPGLSFIGTLVGGCWAKFFGKKKRRKRKSA
jgi:hypothetical protein